MRRHCLDHSMQKRVLVPENGLEARQSETETRLRTAALLKECAPRGTTPTHRKLPAAEGGALSCFSKHLGEKIRLRCQETRVTLQSQHPRSTRGHEAVLEPEGLRPRGEPALCSPSGVPVIYEALGGADWA